MRKVALVFVVAAFFAGSPVFAWTRAGHMVTAAIAYDDLAQRDPAVIDRVLKIVDSHPDRGPFQVAVGRSEGAERGRRIFEELARWPDDIRGGLYDHPTWHYAFRPTIDPAHPPAHLPPDVISGEAYEAFALNYAEARDTLAPAADRAVALGWIFHLVGDIHQPLHTAQLYSSRFADGDHGGSLEYVKDIVTGAPITLHWFWDDSVNRSDDPDAVEARARELQTRYTRASLMFQGNEADWATAFRRWGTDESYPLAKELGFTPGLVTGPDARRAAALPADYVAHAQAAAEKRVAQAGYRLADVLRAIVEEP